MLELRNDLEESSATSRPSFEAVFDEGAGANDLGAFGTTPTTDTYFYVAQAALPATGGSVASLLAGNKWTSVDSASGKTVISYSFIDPATSQFSYSGNEGFLGGASEFSEADKQLTRDLLGKISVLANVQFVEVVDDAAQCGVLRYGYSATPNTLNYAGYAFFPSTQAIGGDIWIGANQAGAQWDFYRPNLILHETLHALGLKHPFSGEVILSTDQDIIPNTVMSYAAVSGSSGGGWMAKYPSEPMPLDAAALQQLYGAASSNEGDDRYDLASARWSGFRLLWDTGGHDTLDASGVARGITLNLATGSSSDIGQSVQARASVGGTPQSTEYVRTFTIGQGVQMEDAVGSSFSDIITGTGAANRIEGRGGDDQIDAGSGLDAAVFSGVRSNYDVLAQVGSSSVSDRTGYDGSDLLFGVERLVFADANVALDIEGNAGKAAKLLGAVFGPNAAEIPEYAGQAIALFDAGNSYEMLMEMALNMRLGPGASDTAVVRLLYTNVVGYAPSEADIRPYLGVLQEGNATRASLGVMAAETMLNAEHLDFVGLAARGIEYIQA